MLQADRDIIARNLQSKHPLKLYCTDNGIFLAFDEHMQLVLKGNWPVTGKNSCAHFFLIKDENAPKGYRLRTEADETRVICIVFTLDGIAVRRGLGCVNVTSGEC